MKLYRARVLERKKVGEHVLLRYEWSGMGPESGQFVGVRAGESLDPFLPRPFFVHDRGEEDISLFFKVRGRVTAALAASGSELLVSAPRGCGFDFRLSGKAALVGGGVWVVPLKLLSRRLWERGFDHDVYLEAPDGAPEEYLRWLREAYPGARLVPTDGRPGSMVGGISEIGGYSDVYVSGDRATLKAVSKVCGGRVRLAVRERMACMDGSCYGCVVPVRAGGGFAYRRACVDGPVFDAEKMAW